MLGITLKKNCFFNKIDFHKHRKKKINIGFKYRLVYVVRNTNIFKIDKTTFEYTQTK